MGTFPTQITLPFRKSLNQCFVHIVQGQGIRNLIEKDKRQTRATQTQLFGRNSPGSFLELVLYWVSIEERYQKRGAYSSVWNLTAWIPLVFCISKATVDLEYERHKNECV